MLEGIIYLLIYICIIALVVYLVIWVLGVIGISLPPKVVQILWVIFGLIVVLLLVRMLLPAIGKGHFLGSLMLPMLA